MNPELQVAKLFDDEALRSHMDDEDAGIWFYAAAAYIRKVARRGGNLDVAYQVASRTLSHANWLISECAQSVTCSEERSDRR